MLEVTGYFTGFDDGGYNRHLSLTVLTLSHIDLEDFSQHFAPTRVFDGTLVVSRKINPLFDLFRLTPALF
jgi:hypothetical protein